PDYLGSAQFVTDEQGYPHEHLEYFPFGEIWVDEHSDTLNTPFLFSGKEIDDETGLSYFGFRYYDARQGQWISADPILDEMLDATRLTRSNPSDQPFYLQGHVYGYVSNNPENLVDANGLVQGGVYVLQDASGTVVRTGRASNLHTRETAHARDPVLG